MTGYNLINLINMIKDLPKERVKDILPSYSCHLNKDVEFFLKYNVIEFAKQGIA